MGFFFFHYIRKISESSSNTLNGWRPLTVYKYASKAQDGSTQLRLHLSERKSTQYFQQLMFIPTVHSETYVDKNPTIYSWAILSARNTASFHGKFTDQVIQAPHSMHTWYLHSSWLGRLPQFYPLPWNPPVLILHQGSP